jgi:hypothetical protein
MNEKNDETDTRGQEEWRQPLLATETTPLITILRVIHSWRPRALAAPRASGTAPQAQETEQEAVSHGHGELHAR